MKISRFAEKHGITSDTVRYYMERGLLVTKKSGGQYHFAKSDSEDLQRIIELKRLEFSLSEIQKILTFQRLTGAKSEEFRKFYLDLLEEKKKLVHEKHLKYKELDVFLKKRIEIMNKEKQKCGKNLGLPIQALEILACPRCGDALNISSGSISDDMIISGHILCQCGFDAEIEQGIYRENKANRKKMLHGQPIPTKEAYLAASSSNYINFLYQGMTIMIDRMDQYIASSKYILELESCVGFFLMQYIDHLPPDKTYILVDYDIDRIIKLKHDLERYYEHKNYLFLCCEYNDLPIKKASVDIGLEFCMNRTYNENLDKDLFSHLMSFIRQDGVLISSNLCLVDDWTQDFNQTKTNNEFLKKDSILQNMKQEGMEILDIAKVGPVVEDNPYNGDLNGKEVFQAIITSEKRK